MQRKSIRFIISMIVIIMVFMGLFTGCGSEKQLSEPEAAEPETEMDAVSEEKEVKIGWYAPGSNQYTDSVGKAAEQFGKDYGVDVRVIYGDTEQATMDSSIRSMVADGYTNITSFPATEGAAGLFDELVSQNVNVVSYGASTSVGSEMLCVASDTEAAAYTACDVVIDAMGGKGNILNVLEVLTDSNTLKRRDGVNRCIAEHDGVELIQEIADINSIDEGVAKISSALSANEGKINGIVCTGTGSSSAAVQVLYDYYARNENADPIYLICIDTADDVMKGIEDGIVYGTMAQNVDAHGYVSCAVLYYMAAEGYMAADNQFLVDSGFVLVTKDNLDTYKDDLDTLTKTITEELTTKYLVKP